MAVRTKQLLNAVTVTGAGTARTPRGSRRTFHASGATTAGAGAASVKVEVSSDEGATWVLIGTIDLVLATTVSGDGFASDAPWALVRGNVDSISGTGAYVSLYMGD